MILGRSKPPEWLHVAPFQPNHQGSALAVAAGGFNLIIKAQGQAFSCGNFLFRRVPVDKFDCCFYACWVNRLYKEISALQQDLGRQGRQKKKREWPVVCRKAWFLWHIRVPGITALLALVLIDLMKPCSVYIRPEGGGSWDVIRRSKGKANFIFCPRCDFE